MVRMCELRAKNNNECPEPGKQGYAVMNKFLINMLIATMALAFARGGAFASSDEEDRDRDKKEDDDRDRDRD